MPRGTLRAKGRGPEPAPHLIARTSWHACCIAISMSAITDANNAFLFLLIAACLGACFVWAFWEMEQMRERRRQMRRWSSTQR
jgi:hypothetical protein